MSKEFEDLLGQYWDLAHLEGKSGVSQGDKANEVLHALKKLAEQPAQQQEPVAWIEHEWSGTGLKHLHFERPEPTVRDEVVSPVWTPLYTSPPAARQQEPVAIVAVDGLGQIQVGWITKPQHNDKLYTSPPAQRKPWVGLTEQEAAECWSTSTVRTWQAIEAKLREKNA